MLRDNDAKPPVDIVVVSDVAGDSASSLIRVTLQGPKMKITSPQPEELFASNSITVTGTVDDPNAAINVNGTAAVNDGGTFTADHVVLREGNNLISATGISAQGQRAPIVYGDS